MKKLLVVCLVLAFVAPAMAADNLSVKGSMRVRSFDNEALGTFNSDTTKAEKIEQRFRMQATVKANDQVKAVTRIDLAESAWGDSNWTGARYANATNSVIQVDRAYLDITTGPVNIIAGQHFAAVGQSQVYRPQKPGIQLTIKTPVIIELGYMMESSEGNGGTFDVDPDPDVDDDRGNDENNVHASIAYKAETFSVEGFYAMQTMTITNAPDDFEDTKTVFGVNGKTSVGPVKLNAELALFGGDNGREAAAKKDYVGLQFNVDADMKFSDMFKLGVDLIYSDGTDDAAKETKIAYVSDVFGRLNRSEGGSGNNIIAGDLAPIGGDDVFDPFNHNLGAIGLGLDAVITPVAGFDILLHVLYLTAAEDAPTGSGLYEDAMVYNLGLTYALAPKAKIGLYYTGVQPSFEGNDTKDDTASNIGGLLQIAF